VMSALLIFVLISVALVEALVIVGPRRMRYLVGEGRLEVRTLYARRRWPVAGLRARRHRARVSLRLAGASMPGYYTGLFRADGKTTRLYATRLEDGVLLEGPARVFLTPEDPGGFLAALREQGATVEETAAPPASR